MLARRRMMRRPVARVATAAVGTAVVAGTAGAVHHHQQQKYAQQDAAAQQQYDQVYQQGVADGQAQQPAPPELRIAPGVEHTAGLVHLLRPADMPDHTVAAQQHLAAHISVAGGGVLHRLCRRRPLCLQQR